MTHPKKVLRVEFTEPAVEGVAELHAAIEEVAKQAQFTSTEECLTVERLKTKICTSSERFRGFVELSVRKGCVENFIALFRKSPSFTSVRIVTA